MMEKFVTEAELAPVVSMKSRQDRGRVRLRQKQNAQTDTTQAMALIARVSTVKQIFHMVLAALVVLALMIIQMSRVMDSAVLLLDLGLRAAMWIAMKTSEDVVTQFLDVLIIFMTSIVKITVGYLLRAKHVLTIRAPEHA